MDPEDMSDKMTPLFDAILDMPKPKIDLSTKTQLLVANIDFDQFKGKLGIGRLSAGSLKAGQMIGVTKPGEPVRQVKVKELFTFDNLGRKQVSSAAGFVARRRCWGTGVGRGGGGGGISACRGPGWSHRHAPRPPPPPPCVARRKRGAVHLGSQ